LALHFLVLMSALESAQSCLIQVERVKGLSDRSAKLLRRTRGHLRRLTQARGSIMDIDQFIKEAHSFVEDNKKRYGEIVDQVKDVCEELMNEYKDIIKDVYSRATKQGGSELKSTEKIAIKLAELQEEFERDRDKPEARFADKPHFLDVPDVIGVTVVVHYPDQIEGVLLRLKDKLAGKNMHPRFKQHYTEKRDLGYHAYHAIYRSKDYQHDGICCEVQCKTMLHDSWSTKMHDLTYKPAGFLDERLRSMMQLFGDTLQQIEIQSQTLRDMIEEQWDVDADLRRLAEEMLLRQLRVWGDREQHSDKTKSVFSRIDDDSAKIRALPPSDPLIDSYREQINELAQENIAEAWFLAAYLASLRAEADLVVYLRGHVDRWLRQAETLATKRAVNPPSDEIKARELAAVRAVPPIFVAAGNRDLAIEYYRKLIADHARYGLDKGAADNMEFDLANVLIEKEYYRPTKSEQERKKLEDEIDKLLHLEYADTAKGIDRKAYDDAIGFKDITFRNDDPGVMRGIRKCIDGRPRGKLAKKFPYAVMYCELHERLGWRRLFALQARNRALRTREKSGRT
jgi:ppGpp synthetase/RelA/SpoT-type nucleotidyltranferase